MRIHCLEPRLTEAEGKRIAQHLGTLDDPVEALYYPMWLLNMKVSRRFPLLRPVESMLTVTADGLTGQISLLAEPAFQCEVEPFPGQVLPTHIQIDSQIRDRMAETVLPYVMSRLRSPFISPSIQLMGETLLYKKIFRMRVHDRLGARTIYLDAINGEYACLPREVGSSGRDVK